MEHIKAALGAPPRLAKRISATRKCQHCRNHGHVVDGQAELSKREMMQGNNK